MASQQPAYLTLSAVEIERRLSGMRERGASCDWCPRRCGADRLQGEPGACGAGGEVLVASSNLHFGEEAHFVGNGGSGTVFFSCCSIGCLFCQNYDISHQRCGTPVSTGQLALMFLSLQREGAENINLVTPSHYPAEILAALKLVIDDGLRLPIVWNSGGYDAVETLKSFESMVDIYMPDFKFADDDLGAVMSGVMDYASQSRLALAEMVRQVGPGLVIEDGIARRGMSVRHLVMPGYYDNSRQCLDFLRSLSPQITVNIMSQYRPAYRAREVPGLHALVDFQEYRRICSYARSIGLVNVLEQA